jgi:outer membrane protein
MKNILKYIIFSFLLFVTNNLHSQKKWTLEDCIKYAKENNVEVIKQKIRSAIVNSDIKISQGNYLPDANFNASQNLSLGNSFNVSTNVGQSESSSNSFSLSSSLPIFNGFSNKYKLEKSRLEKEKSEAEIERIRFDLNLNITNKFLQVLFNKEILKLTNQQFNISKQNYNRLKKLYSKALTGKRELLEIEATLSFDQKENLVAENNVQNSLIVLQELLGITEIKNFEIAEILVKNFISKNFEFNDEILDRNPIIISSKLDLELKNRDIKLSKANFFPRINLNYLYSSNYFHILGQEDLVFNQITNQNEPNGFWMQLNNNRTHYIGLSAVFPIFNRFLTRENNKKAKEELKISKIEFESNKQVLRNKIKIASNDVKTAESSLSSSKIAYTTQNEAFEIIQKQYLLGNINNYEFLESKAKLNRNNSDYIKAKYEYFFKVKILNYYFFK